MSIDFSQKILDRYFPNDWIECFKFLSSINEVKEIVKFAVSGKIPDENIDYWNEKLRMYETHLSDSKSNVKHCYRTELSEMFHIDALMIDVEMVLAKFEQRKLELVKLKELNKSVEKSSTNDGIRQEVTYTDPQQNDSATNDTGLLYQDIPSKLPEFHGKNFDEWLKFSSAFTELVHNNTQMPISTKLNYLREKIKDKPLTLIAYLISGPDSNYKLAWETLEKRYGNRRILFTSKLDCLLDMEIMKSENYSSVQKMHDTAKECIYLIKKHLNRDIGGDSADEIFAHIIIRKMDAGARAQYEQYVRKTKSIQKLQDVMEFLEQQSEILENLEKCEDSEPKPPANTNIFETME